MCRVGRLIGVIPGDRRIEEELRADACRAHPAYEDAAERLLEPRVVVHNMGRFCGARWGWLGSLRAGYEDGTRNHR